MFKTGILLDSLRLPLEESLEIASESDIDGIQIYAVPHYMASFNLDLKTAKSLLKKVEGYGLEISALCGDLGGHGFEIQSENPGKIKATKNIIDFASELKTRIITTHIGVISETDTVKNSIMQEALYGICSYAENAGVYIAIETGPEKSKVLKNFISEIGAKSLKVNFDPANLLMVQGENPPDAVFALKDYIVYTHAKDGVQLKKCDPVRIYNAFAEGNPDKINIDEYFVELPIGEGNVNFPEYMKALKEIGYTGYLTIEREAGDDRIKDIKDGVDFIKAWSPTSWLLGNAT